MKPLRKTTPYRSALSSTMLASSSRELGLPLNDVVIVFACSENFVPYLSVAVQSIVENASATRRYDIIVLTRDLSPTSMITLTRQTKSANVGVGFLDVDAALGDIKLPHHGHFRPETYFRLLAPSLLPNVKKAIYLDSDLIVNADIAELFDTDVTGYLLGATRDADTLGQMDGYDATVGPYLENELGMTDAHDYFQAGVLLMNWQHLRRTHIVKNAAPDVRQEYEEARQDPKIVHFAGPDNRPWLYPDADGAGLFWRYAMHSPYLEEIRAQLEESRDSVAGLAKRLQVIMLYKGIMPAFDKTCPGGTKRRSAIIRIYDKLGGTRL